MGDDSGEVVETDVHVGKVKEGKMSRVSRAAQLVDVGVRVCVAYVDWGLGTGDWGLGLQ
jgi:hypothetical protein